MMVHVPVLSLDFDSLQKHKRTFFPFLTFSMLIWSTLAAGPSILPLHGIKIEPLAVTLLLWLHCSLSLISLLHPSVILIFFLLFLLFLKLKAFKKMLNLQSFGLPAGNYEEQDV